MVRAPDGRFYRFARPGGFRVRSAALRWLDRDFGDAHLDGRDTLLAAPVAGDLDPDRAQGRGVAERLKNFPGMSTGQRKSTQMCVAIYP